MLHKNKNVDSFFKTPTGKINKRARSKCVWHVGAELMPLSCKSIEGFKGQLNESGRHEETKEET